MTTTDETTAELPRFSAALRDATWQDHEQAESSTYMTALMGGELPLDGYANLAAQQWFVYAVLEAASDAMRSDPVAAPFVFDELTRLPAIEADLRHLMGDDWSHRIESLPATTAYCDRIRSVCFDQPGAFVAHHYTRYLGDLSGGQYIGRVVKRVYELDDAGASFFTFAAIDDAKAFKDGYRARLDAAPWSPDEQDAVIAEIRNAYRLNRDVFADLDATLS
jgi:heme oxygenase (biliverdin-producing, ferredoxin)